MVDQESQPPYRNNKELHPERIMVTIIGGLELHVDEVNSGIGTPYVDHLWKKREE